MSNHQRHLPLLIVALLLLGILLGACNMPNATKEPGRELESQAGTLAAQTLEAFAKANATKTPTRTPQSTPTKVPPTPSETPNATETPTEAPQSPNAPGLENYDYYCEWTNGGINLTITIKWTDKSNNELGFIVRRDGEEIANLLPGQVSYFDAYAVSTGQVVNYAVQAYNNYGVSEQAVLSVSCE